MKASKLFLVKITVLAVALGWVWQKPLPGAAQRALDFNRDIRSILSDKCFACHGPDATAKKLTRFDSAAAAAKVIVPGKPEQSKLIQRITHADEDMRMPPQASGRALTEREKELLTEWIGQGAPWQSHWAFVAPQRPALPPVKNSAWAKNAPKNAIDAFVLARLEKEGLQPAPAANRTTLLRRVSHDLVIKADNAPPQVYVQDHGASLYRRTLYTFWKRTIAPPFMLNFDGAGRETCSGGPSQLDLFDPKPQLEKYRGQELPDSIRQGQRLTGMTAFQASFPVAPSIFKFAQHGQSGAWMSEAVPHTAKHADRLAFIKSMHCAQAGYVCSELHSRAALGRTRCALHSTVSSRLGSARQLPKRVEQSMPRYRSGDGGVAD